MAKKSRFGKILVSLNTIFPNFRLRHIILASLFLSLVLAEGVALLPASIYWRTEEAIRSERDTLMLLRANVDSTTFPTVADTVRLGERLITFSAVRGGVILNMLGDELGVFGMPPTLRLSEAQRGNPSHLSSDQRFLDVYFPQHRTGLAFPLILRLDNSIAEGAVVKRLRDTFLVVLGVALTSSIVLVTIVGILVIRPVLRLRDAATGATEHPTLADTYRLRWSRSDELGQAARALDQLLAGVSVVHQDDIAAYQDAVQGAPYAVLTYDAKGRLINANPAALVLFGAANVDAMNQQPSAYLKVNEGSESRDLTPLDLIETGDTTRFCGVETPKGLKNCYVSVVTVMRRKSQTLMHYVVNLVDISQAVAYSQYLEGKVERLGEDNITLRRRLGEQRQLFESCTIILSNLQSDNRAAGEKAIGGGPEKPFILIESIIDEWCNDAIRNSLILGRRSGGRLPAIRGEANVLNSIFRQALLSAYTHSRWARPILSIEARPALTDGALVFDVVTSSVNGQQGEPSDPSLRTGGMIAMLGLKKALGQVGGRMVETSLSQAEYSLSFAIPVTENDYRRHAVAA